MEETSVKVYVNDAEEPDLEVERIIQNPIGGIGFVVDSFDGAFADLHVTPAE